jgi:two-component system response regulator NreC
MGKPQPLTIVIADDHAMVRQGLQLLLEAEPDFSVCGEVGDLPALGAYLTELAPTILLLDLHMGSELSLDELGTLQAASPETGIIVLTMQADPAFARRALAAGAAGYVLKEASRTELAQAIRTVAGGGTYLHPALGARALAEPEPEPDAGLTDREREVLRLLALGHTNSEIAAQLFVSVRTVDTHRANMQRKLGVSGRPELVRHALRLRIIHQ